jgi:hypothetical protein
VNLFRNVACRRSSRQTKHKLLHYCCRLSDVIVEGCSCTLFPILRQAPAMHTRQCSLGIRASRSRVSTQCMDCSCYETRRYALPLLRHTKPATNALLGATNAVNGATGIWQYWASFPSSSRRASLKRRWGFPRRRYPRSCFCCNTRGPSHVHTCKR